MFGIDRSIGRGILLFISLLMLPVLSASADAKSLDIINYQLISKTPVAGDSDDDRERHEQEHQGNQEQDKGTYEYVYRADLRNSGASVYDVRATVISTSSKVRVKQSVLTFDLVLAGKTLTSPDTFTIRAKNDFDKRLLGDNEILRWKIAAKTDTVPPIISAQAPQDLFVASARPVISAQYQDIGSGVDAVKTRLLLDGRDVSSSAVITATDIQYQPTFALSEGAHTLELNVTDRIGNTTRSTWSFSVDTVAPVISALTPADGSTQTSDMPPISAQYRDAGGVNFSKAQLTLDGVDITANAAVSATGIIYQPVAALSEGRHDIRLTIMDSAGNSSQATWSFNIQAVVPTISGQTPVNGSVQASATPAISAQYQVAVGSIDLNKVQLTVDGINVTTAAAVSATGISYQPSVALAQGRHDIVLMVADMAGKSLQTSWNFSVDTIAPVISAQTPADGSVQPSNTPTISAQYQDIGGMDLAKTQLLVDGVAVSAAVGAAGISYQSAVALAEGQHSLALTVVDLAGNSSQSTWSFTVDTVLPVISIPTPIDGSAQLSNIPVISAQYQDVGGIDLSKVQLSIDAVNVVASVSATGISYQPVVALAEGQHAVVLTVPDLAGNRSQLVWNFSVDTVAPTISVPIPVDGSIQLNSVPFISASYQDVGGVDISKVQLTVDGFNVSAVVSTAGISYQPTLALAEGPHDIVLTVVDIAGNSSRSVWRFSIDTVAPIINAMTPLDGGAQASGTPIISAQYQDVGGVDINTVQLLVDGIDVTASAVVSVTGISYQPTAALFEGQHTVALAVSDLAGKRQQSAWSFSVDTIAPVISAPTPVDGSVFANGKPAISAQYQDAGGVDIAKVQLMIDGTSVNSSAVVSSTGISYQPTVALADGRHTIALTVVDMAGNSSQTTWNLSTSTSLDPVTFAPASTNTGVAATVVVSVKIAASDIDSNSVKLHKLDAQGRTTEIGTLHDDGLQSDAVANDGNYTLRFTIYEQQPGVLTYRVAANVVGQGTTLYSSPFVFSVTGISTAVKLTQPLNFDFVNISPIIVTGTTSDPAASVMVNGIPAAKSGNTFQLTVPLQEGTNTITAVATNSNASTTTTSLQVTLDTTPPKVTISSPPDNFKTSETSVTVTGIVNDIVVGTVNDQQASVTVNGVSAQVINRTYTAVNVPLQPGLNTLRIIGTDRTGNSATATVHVTQEQAIGATVKQLSGNNQTGTIASQLSAPLVVEVMDGVTPLANVPVIFKIKDNDGLLQSDTSRSSIVIVNTDATGKAQVNYTLGNRAGAGNNVVEAYSTKAKGVATFTASATPQMAAMVNVDSGNSQFGAIGQPLVLPFVAVVTDQGYNRLGGIPVTFTARQGGGTFAGGNVDVNGIATLQTVTDGDGRALATLTLGTQPGQDNNVVEVAVTGSAVGLPAVFTATAKTPGDANNTRISGVVLDNSNNPIPGVTMRLYRTYQGSNNNQHVEVVQPVVTDAKGMFTIAPAPVGLFKLMADGVTATDIAKLYPTLEFDLVTVAGQDNTVGSPIYLQSLDILNRVCVNETTGGTLTLPDSPGFSLTIKPGSATFPGGSKAGCVSATPVNIDKIPMSPGFGQQPRYVVTIQPVGTTFNPPMSMTIPNVDGLAPRAKTEMYSYDHDLAAFVAIGSATVSADGSLITSDPGIGVMKAGWHCGGNPNTAGTVANCPTCRKCNGVDCSTPDDTQTPPQNSPTDCKQEVCQGGIVSIAKDSEKPVDVCRKCQGGFDVSDVAKNATACDDGPAVCDIDKCLDGTCTHKEVSAVTAFGPPDSAPAGSLTAATSTALTCLQDGVSAKLKALNVANGGMVVTTTYRSQEYQDHLVEVWDKVNLLNGWSEAECDPVRANHITEKGTHFPMGAPARGVSRHTLGTAFDATVTGLSDADITTIATGCNLTRPVANEPWHFER